MAARTGPTTPVGKVPTTRPEDLCSLPGTSQAKHGTKCFVSSAGEVKTGESLDFDQSACLMSKLHVNSRSYLKNRVNSVPEQQYIKTVLWPAYYFFNITSLLLKINYNLWSNGWGDS